MEQFEAIRRDYAREELSIRALARRHGVHRRAVRQALADPVPPPKRPPSSRPVPKLGPYRTVIEDWLRADLRVPRKQRHTARRIWQRLIEEYGAEVSERQVDRYVAAVRRRMGEVEAFVPLVADAGVEAEVDWGQAQVILRGEPVMVHVFVMRACHSGAAFVMAFGCGTQQAFLEGHVRAFEWFQGVFETLRYDNLGSAVARVLKGRRRVECDRFVALRSHYLFESSFCLPGKQGAHEKGGVEGEVGRFRRRHLVPVPKVGSIAELNEQLEEACWADLDRTIVGRGEPVGEALERERRLLGGLPREAHCTAQEATPRVDSKAMVTCPREPLLGPRAPGRPAGARADRLADRSMSGTKGRSSLAMSGWRANTKRARSSSITWICSRASPARSRGASRCARSATAVTGQPASMSSGARSRSAQGARRPPGRWSTC